MAIHHFEKVRVLVQAKTTFRMEGYGGGDIKRLGDDSIRRIVAEQAITDLSNIVKELVDNALDAESSIIKGKKHLYGLLCFVLTHMLMPSCHHSNWFPSFL